MASMTFSSLIPSKWELQQPRGNTKTATCTSPGVDTSFIDWFSWRQDIPPVHNGPKWAQMSPNGPQWAQMGPMGPNGPVCPMGPMGPNVLKRALWIQWAQMGPLCLNEPNAHNGSKWVQWAYWDLCRQPSQNGHGHPQALTELLHRMLLRHIYIYIYIYIYNMAPNSNLANLVIYGFSLHNQHFVT